MANKKNEKDKKPDIPVTSGDDIVIAQDEHEPPSEGEHVLTVVGFKDYGVMKSEKFGESDRMSIVFELDELDSNGKPKQYQDFCNKTVREKSKLRKIVLALTGADPVMPFKPRNILGLRCRAQFAFNPEKENATYPDIVAYMRLKPAAKAAQSEAEQTLARSASKTRGKSNGKAVSTPNPTDFDPRELEIEETDVPR